MSIFTKIISVFMAFIAAIIAIFSGNPGGGGETTTSVVETTTTAYSTTAEFAALKAKAEANKVTYNAQINESLTLLNNYRKSRWKNALTLDNNLTVAACMRAQEMVDSGILVHARPDGRGPMTVLNDLSISAGCFGENLARGQETPTDVFNDWKGSTDHNANMLRTQYGKVGIGVAVDNSGTIYWVQVFTD